MIRQKPDEVGEILDKVDVGEILDVEFGSLATMKCRVVHTSDETGIHRREIVLQSEEHQSIIVGLDEQTRPNEINHFRNKAYIKNKAGRFGKVTKAVIK